MNLTYNDFISQFLTKNYKRLEETAIKYTDKTNFEAQDILAELAIYLYDNETKINNITSNSAKEARNNKEHPLLLFSCKWIINNLVFYKKSKTVNGNNFQHKYTNDSQPIEVQTEEALMPAQITEKLGYTEQNHNWEPVTDEELKYQILDEILENDLDYAEKELYKLKVTQKMYTNAIVAKIPGTTLYQINQLLTGMHNKINTKMTSEFNKRKLHYK